MKRKKKIIILFTTIGIILTIVIMYHRYINIVRKFSINNYKSYIEEYPSDIVLDKIGNSKKAKEEAIKIFIKIYGKEIKKKEPFIVYYDKNSKTWMVRGSMPFKCNLPWYSCGGGVPEILISEEGTVLAIWYGK